jgi:hypothetical protein
MKRFELVKREDHYGLYNEDGHKIAATLDGCNSKLSKENCDEIFGVVDVDKLAEEWCMRPENNWSNNNNEVGDNYGSYKEGFNKAMDLNKDKLFTVEDLYRVERCYLRDCDNDVKYKGQIVQRILNEKTQQPTEIEVEIRCWIGNGDKESDSFKDPLVTNTGIPKLDADGCLILRKL